MSTLKPTLPAARIVSYPTNRTSENPVNTEDGMVTEKKGCHRVNKIADINNLSVLPNSRSGISAFRSGRTPTRKVLKVKYDSEI